MLAAKISPDHEEHGLALAGAQKEAGRRRDYQGLQSAHLSHHHGDSGRWYSSSRGNFLIKISSVFVFQAGLDPGFTPVLSEHKQVS